MNRGKRNKRRQTKERGKEKWKSIIHNKKKKADISDHSLKTTRINNRTPKVDV